MSNPDLGGPEYLCYEVVRQMTDADRDVPKTDFNKLCFLVYKELQDRGLDVKLPHYWYQYGEVVDTEEINIEWLNWEPTRWEQRRGERAVIDPEYSDDDFIADGGTKRGTRSVVTDVVDEYKSEYGTDIAKQYTYEIYAPNNFIIHLNNLRSHVEDTDPGGRLDADVHVPNVEVSFRDFQPDETEDSDDFSAADSSDVDLGQIEDWLNKLVETYPHDYYTYADTEFRHWESLCRQMVRNQITGTLIHFINDFWLMFSRVELRINHHENISPVKVQRWRNEREEHIEQFRSTLKDRRDFVLQNREPTNKLDNYAESYSNVVRERFDQVRNQSQ